MNESKEFNHFTQIEHSAYIYKTLCNNFGFSLLISTEASMEGPNFLTTHHVNAVQRKKGGD